MLRAEQLAEQLIRKASLKNDPLEALSETPEFGKFQRALYLAIRRQFKSFIDNPPTELEAYDIEKWLDDNLPDFSEYLDAQDIFEYYKFAFVWGVKSQYQRLGIKTHHVAQKAAEARELSDSGFVDGAIAGFAWTYDGNNFNFNLTNEEYIASLKSSADYLLNLSSISQTTRNQLIQTVQEGRTAGKTIQEITADLTSNFEDMAQWRALRIARTESANSMGSGNFAAMKKNGVSEKKWVRAGPGCDICDPNVDDGYVPTDEAFSSGDLNEPAHPNCECYTEAGEINLDSIDIWNGQ